MTLTVYLTAGSFPAGVSAIPETWTPAWAKTLVDALAADHDTERKVKTGEAAQMTHVGIKAALGPVAGLTFLMTLKLAGQTGGYDFDGNGAPAGTNLLLNEYWADVVDRKGFYSYEDAQTRSGLDSLVALGILSTTQRAAIHTFWTEPKKVWEVAGLDRLPTAWDVINATGWTTPGGGS